MKYNIGVAALLTIVGAAAWSAVVAATSPSLGTASTFAILAGPITPNEAGFATQAQIDVLRAYRAAIDQACTQNLGGQNLGGVTVTPGVICVSPTSTWSGQLTLNAQGSAGNVFIIRSTGDLAIGSNSSLMLSNGAQASNVFVVVDGNLTVSDPSPAATSTSNPTIAGTFIARRNITIGSNVRVDGHLFSTEGTVTASAANVTCAGCMNDHPTLILTKNVVNDSGGTSLPTDFVLLINDMDTLSGRINILAPGVYTIDELDSAGYSGPTISGACGANGVVTLANGEDKACTLTNNDIGLPNTGAGGNLMDNMFWLMRTLLLAGAAGGITFFGLRAKKLGN